MSLHFFCFWGLTLAVAKHLPIWRDAHQLVHTLYQSTRKAPRELRHTLVTQILTEAVEVCVHIDTANRRRGQERADAIAQLQTSIARVSVMLPIALEHRCLSTGAAATAIEHTDAVSRQAHGWRESTLSPSQQPDPEPST